MIDISIFSRFEFHDLPVNGIAITTDPHLAIIIYISPSNDALQGYDYFKLHFTDVEAFHLDEVNFTEETDLEIYTCDYEVREDFLVVTFTLLDSPPGGGPSAYMMITCKGLWAEQYVPESF